MTETIKANPSNLSKKSVSSLAEMVAKEIGYNKHKNISKSISDLGGEIIIRDFWESNEKTGSLEVNGIGKFKIYIPEHTSIERDRFTIAHELGHYIVHYVYKHGSIGECNLIADRYGSGRVEWEANWFAASFLMPEKEFRIKFKQFEGNIHRIAEHFSVSQKAATVRAKSLGLIDTE
jgi:predicted transcriptional regulator